MRKVVFLIEEELKKILRSRYLYVFVVVFVLDIIALLSEYSDRLRSTLYSSGVHVAGQGMSYLVKHEFGNFGVLVIYLLPLLFIAAPIFADESENKILSQIRVTQNGRMVDSIVKTTLVLGIQFIWMIVFTIFSVVASFGAFDVSIASVGVHISEILKCIINLMLGCFCMCNIFLFISAWMKKTVSAMGTGFAIIVIPMFIETEKLWTHVFPIIGMQAECLQIRSNVENLYVWSAYFFIGMVFLSVNLINNK